MNEKRRSPESSRITDVYSSRDQSSGSKYAFYQPDLRLVLSQREWEIASFLKSEIQDVSSIRILDIGCGKGELLSTLSNWGCDPNLLVGTEYLEDRLEYAKLHSNAQVNWHLGGIRQLPKEEFDVVFMCTVLSSILDNEMRIELITDALERLKPSGWLVIFDFRYNNPSNSNVRKVTRNELEEIVNSRGKSVYKNIGMLPPISRVVTPYSYTLSSLLSSLIPPLRSHFLYRTQKNKI